MKNHNDPIGNRTRDPPACTAFPQPTAPPRAPYILLGVLKFLVSAVLFYVLSGIFFHNLLKPSGNFTYDQV
jgi:hypothetical protein